MGTKISKCPLGGQRDKHMGKAKASSSLQKKTRWELYFFFLQQDYGLCIFHCMDSRVDLFHQADLSCVPSQLSELPSRVKSHPNMASRRRDICSSITDTDSHGSPAIMNELTTKSLCWKAETIKTSKPSVPPWTVPTREISPFVWSRVYFTDHWYKT